MTTTEQTTHSDMQKQIMTTHATPSANSLAKRKAKKAKRLAKRFTQVQRKHYVNRKRFTAVKYNLGRLQNQIAKNCFFDGHNFANGHYWVRRVFDNRKFEKEVAESVQQLFGTCDIFVLLDRMNEGDVLDPVAVDYIDMRLEKRFIRYLNRVNLTRYENLVSRQLYASHTIEYFFVKARMRYNRDLTSVAFYEQCMRELVTYNSYSLLRTNDCECDTTIDVIETCKEHNWVSVQRTRRGMCEDLTSLVEKHEARLPPLERDLSLLAKLRILILRLVSQRTNQNYDDCIERQMRLIDIERGQEIIPQMMDCETEPEADKTVKAPVVLTNSEGCKDVPVLVERPEIFWANASTADALVSVSHANEFEILASKFNWTSSNNTGFKILEVDLPNEVISNNLNHPAAMQFLQYAYWIGSIRVRLHLNTTPMQVGKLVMFFHYSAKLDLLRNNRVNIANAVQFPHVFYDAASAQDACLDIPFRNHRSFLCTRPRIQDSKPFYMGTLYLMVFNPLRSAAESLDVDGYIHVSFHDNHYTGILKRTTVVPQMFSIPASIAAAESALNLINRARNMDKPISSPVPAFMQPTFTSSMASGDNDISTIHHMRLDPRGQTQHPAGSSTSYSETSIDSLKTIPGLLGQYSWSTGIGRGTPIVKWPATLAQPRISYPRSLMTIGGSTILGYVLPPVCMLADMHAFSRGSFKIIVELVNSRFHTGALLIAYSPAVTDQAFDDAILSYNMTLDCGSVNRYEFTVPYIAERPLAPRYNQFDGSTAPEPAGNGVVGLYVLNQLRSTTTSNVIDINVYIAGTAETEFTCLTAPSFTVLYDDVGGVFPDKVLIPASMGAIGCGTWRYTTAVSAYLNVLRYGDGSDHVLQFPGMLPFTVYQEQFQQEARNLALISARRLTSANSYSASLYDIGHPKYICRLIVNGDGDKYFYATAFETLTAARAYCTYHKSLVTAQKPYPDSPAHNLLPSNTYTGFAPTDPSAYRVYANANHLQYVVVPDTNDIDIIPQMDGNAVRKEEPTCSVKGLIGLRRLTPLDNGMRLFGESFKDLKSYVRRYQQYTTFTCTPKSNNTFCARVPILPCGLAPTGSSLISREGLIPFINSNYVFGRGSIQLKIFLDASGSTRDDSTLFIQHKFDVHSSSRSVVTSATKQALNVLQSGYAVVAMNPQINPTVTLEIPFYAATNLILVQRTDAADKEEVVNSSLGVLDFYKNSGTACAVTIHYALADDFDYSAYIGLPPVVPIENLVTSYRDFEIIPQMDPVPSTSKQLNPNGMFSNIKDRFSKAIEDKIEDVTMTKTREFLKLKERVDDDSFKNIISDFIAKTGSEYKHIIISILSQIIHYVKDPCVSTAIVCITTLFAHLGFEFGIFDLVASKVMNLFGRSSSVTPNGMNDENESEESSEAVKLGFVKAIVAACSKRLGRCSSTFKNIPYTDFSKGVWTNIRFGALTFNTLVIFIKNLVEYIPKIFEWLAKVIDPRRWLTLLWKKDSTMVDQWITDCRYVIDPANASRIHFDSRMSVLLQVLVLVGADITNRLVKMGAKANEFAYIRGINAEINKLYTALVMSNSASGIVRAEPYCFAVWGASQVGKTFNSRDVAEYALWETGYRNFENPTYIRQPGLPYWTGLMNQLICIMEDFLQIETSEKAWADVYDLIHLVSCQVFQPPQAEISKKYIRFAPLIVVLTMNKAYPVVNGIADGSAWQNRRHDLFKFENTMNVSPKYMSKEVQDTRSYLKVKKHKYSSNVKADNDITDKENIFDKVSVVKTTPTGDLLYHDDGSIMREETTEMTYWQFRYYVKERFEVEYKRIVVQYKQALDKLTSFWPDEDQTLVRKYEKYTDHYSTRINDFSDNDRKLLELCCSKQGKEMCKVCSYIKCECTCESLRFMQTKTAKEILSENMQDDEVEPLVPQMALSARANEFVQRMRDVKKVTSAETKKIFPVHQVRSFMLAETVDKNLPNTLKIEYVDYLCKFNISLENALVDRYFTTKCPHELLLKIDHVSNIVFFTFYKNKFIYKDCNLSYPSIECCTDSVKNNCFAMLHRVEEFQLAKGILNEPVPKPVVRPSLLVNYYANNAYLEFEEQYKEYARTLKSRETWLGSWGEPIFKTCKVILTVVAGLSTVFAVTSFATKFSSDGKDGVAKYIRDSLLTENAITVRRIAQHVPNDDCVNGKCRENICGNMAYDLRQISRKSMRKVPKLQQTIPQMADDMRHSIERIIMRNTFFLRATWVDDGGTNSIQARCVGLKDNHFVAIDHYFERFKLLSPDTRFEFVQPNCKKEIKYYNLNLRKLQDSACVIGTLPRTIPCFANIVSKICSMKNGANLSREGLLYEVNLDKSDDSFRMTVYKQDFAFKNSEIHVPSMLGCSAATRIFNYYSYNIGGVGMCGSLLVSDSNIVSPIVGIHVAGTRDNKTGYSDLLSRESFELALEEISTEMLSSAIEHVDINEQPVVIDPQGQATAELFGNYLRVGVVDPEFAHRPPPKTKVRHSECYNEITQSTYDFPILSPHDSRATGSPMVVGCQHHVNPPKDFDEYLLKEAVDIVRGSILSKVVPQRQVVGKLEVDQVVVGIPENALYNALEFDTSEGFPFTRFRPEGAMDKRWLFDLDVNETGYVLNDIHPFLLEVMHNKQAEREKGIVPVTVFTDCLKDIKVPAEKCQPRIFSISPADFTIQFKQYFSDFMIAYQEARFDVNSAIGINVDSFEWTKMTNMLLNNSSHFGCGDYSKFGPRLMSSVVQYAFDLINEWYSLHGDGHNNMIRRIMGHEVTFSVHMMFNLCYQVITGAPSGSAITTILNNIVNVIYIAYCWCYTLREHRDMIYSELQFDTNFSFQSFFSYVSLICYGDDLIMTIKEEVLEFFNPIVLKKIFEIYDIKFTDAGKSGKQFASLSVFSKDTSFLKRRIGIHPYRSGVFVAKMDKRALEETCNWIHKCTDVRGMSIIVCQAMLLNAHGHGPLYYENLRKRVRSYWCAKKVDCPIPSWQETDERIFGAESMVVTRCPFATKRLI